ncbi:ATP synthase F1 subunit gamma [Chondrinema litorale]|uniref:ATP synthase F1 subunit gamma n=1 Tax=Chondrinema litorale TaxID=2994555 RepID=UPI002544A742|nr:ATP synthase F1 subunit gamma [Chondrinema litorale]UZR95042.1 ATP synthase F1 subunit gamma [Chondrinema litorale]
MPNLKEVKNRIVSVKSTQQITKAMKMVAAAKLRKAQDRIIQIRPYSQKLNNILQNVSATLGDEIENAYAVEREVKKVLIVVITSDRGLCGGFNANVSKKALSLIEGKYQTQLASGNVEILSIGKKGYDYFKRRDFNVNTEYLELFSDLNFDSVRAAAEYAMNGFLAKEFDVVDIIYNEFKNVATQETIVEQFLPITSEVSSGNKEQDVQMDYIFEPNKMDIVKELIPKSLKISFYKFLLESNAAEHGARMTAMDKATDNAQELIKELQLTYNRTRQAAITTEILEIVGGAEALANG